MSEMAEAIRELIQEKGVSEESVRQTIESAIKAAYKRTFGKMAENCVVKFADDMSDVMVYSRKTIVDGVYDPVNGEAPALSGIELPSACYGPRNSTLRRVETIQVEQVGTDNLFRVSVTVSTVGGHSSGTSFTVTPLG